MAERLKEVLREAGCTFFLESPTNQQFVVLENQQLEKLKKGVVFSIWEALDETHTIARFVTSWATKPEDIEKLRELLAE